MTEAMKNGSEMSGPAEGERRDGQRQTSLIRTAKLISARGEFVAILRDVSQSGISLHMFHEFPTCPQVALELRNGASFELNRVRGSGDSASFSFAEKVDIDKLLSEDWHYPKRGLRLNIAMPVMLESRDKKAEGFTSNLSQQGAGVECDEGFAVDQLVTLSSDHLKEIPARVRWCRDGQYGLVFERTYSLRDFAILGAKLQCPGLVHAEDRFGQAA